MSKVKNVSGTTTLPSRSLIGQVACVKVTGEKLFVISFDEATNIYHTRRPEISEKGVITHLENDFTYDELETLQEHSDRQIAEHTIKLLAQKKLATLESKVMQEMELEQAVGPMGEAAIEQIAEEAAEEIADKVSNVVTMKKKSNPKVN
jgi:hypothetical protein